MNANYAEICRVGNFKLGWLGRKTSTQTNKGDFEAGFQQVPLAQIFWNFLNIVVKHW